MSSRPTRATIDGRTYLDLQNLARRTKRSTQELLHLYALEGFLARLATSPHAHNFVLKGGVLLAAYGSRRATRDIDLQGRQLASDVESVLRLVQDIASTAVDDGLAFNPDTAAASHIREADDYPGIRVNIDAQLATARIEFHVDINVGDPIWPPPERITVPGILGREVLLWRDFADIYTLSGQHPTDSDKLRSSIEQVATYRKVALAPRQPAGRLGRTTEVGDLAAPTAVRHRARALQ